MLFKTVNKKKEKLKVKIKFYSNIFRSLKAQPFYNILNESKLKKKIINRQ